MAEESSLVYFVLNISKILVEKENTKKLKELLSRYPERVEFRIDDSIKALMGS